MIHLDSYYYEKKLIKKKSKFFGKIRISKNPDFGPYGIFEQNFELDPYWKRPWDNNKPIKILDPQILMK